MPPEIIPPKPCAHCSEPIVRREAERPHIYKRRIYCSRRCAGNARKTAPYPK